MAQAELTLDPAFTVTEVHRCTFGSFIKHMGRCVCTGIFEPGHPAADENGIRRDVVDLARESGVTTVRYPGGTFALRAFPGHRLVEHHVLADGDVRAANTQAQPDRIRPRTADTAPLTIEGRLTAELPPASWNVLRFSPAAS